MDEQGTKEGAAGLQRTAFLFLLFKGTKIKGDYSHWVILICCECQESGCT